MPAGFSNFQHRIRRTLETLEGYLQGSFFHGFSQHGTQAIGYASLCSSKVTTKKPRRKLVEA